MSSKARSQRSHARKRALQRFDVQLNRHQLQALVTQIQNGFATLVERQSLRVSVWRITLEDGRRPHVVYDKQRKTIVTFLPEDDAAA